MDVRDWRELFPITKHRVFLNHAAVAPLSKPAADAMRWYVEQTETTAGVGAGYYRRAEQVRRMAAALIGADPDEALVSGCEG